METTTKSTTTTITDVIAAGRRYDTEAKRRSMCDYLRDTHHIDDSYTVISYDWTPQYDRCCIAMTRNGNLLICQINSLGHGDWDAYTRFIDLAYPRDVAESIVMLMLA